MKYRPEIDGLRAVAVMLVLLYHAAFGVFGRHDLFGAGDIGVDIFFVISGYLITKIILKEMSETGTFSFRKFYERRARRILPALFFIILASFPVAIHVLPPLDLATYLDSLLYIVFFVSNYFFYQNHVGFGGEEQYLFEPFLHTWSLAIEEQFYLVFPVILLLCARYFKRFTLSILLVLFSLSLLFAEFNTNRHGEFNYFMLPSRFWELLAGALLAHLEQEYGKIRRPLLNAVMPVVGMASILWFLLLFDPGPEHPSLTTLVPVLGTVLIIAFASQEDLVGRILSFKPIVGIGLISYSLYLWHYPVYTYFEITQPDATNLDKVGWIILSFLFAIISYFCIEQPFRNRKLVTPKPFYISLVAVAALIVSVTLFGDPVKIAQLSFLAE
ncbi:acyltransferase family protein [Sneathiella sp. HT1-7]|uniref:acyltransferase family protein n=1 Tax=Sneathiella sp. HT1-7 TaxID=2887192 RepID=UPI001D156F3C|nr:acyltransferase [Sneathiella sp. HT1-7]MCC3304830.1 acyltransferase [Sneathiella sp. HT1-7]